eukprot:COSAG02_NODE_50231_length_322_cov_0.439462_1_plen_78_part_01
MGGFVVVVWGGGWVWWCGCGDLFVLLGWGVLVVMWCVLRRFRSAMIEYAPSRLPIRATCEPEAPSPPPAITEPHEPAS